MLPNTWPSQKQVVRTNLTVNYPQIVHKQDYSILICAHISKKILKGTSNSILLHGRQKCMEKNVRGFDKMKNLSDITNVLQKENSKQPGVVA